MPQRKCFTCDGVGEGISMFWCCSPFSSGEAPEELQRHTHALLRTQLRSEIVRVWVAFHVRGFE
jgi:hypothetical protein